VGRYWRAAGRHLTFRLLIGQNVLSCTLPLIDSRRSVIRSEPLLCPITTSFGRGRIFAKSVAGRDNVQSLSTTIKQLAHIETKLWAKWNQISLMPATRTRTRQGLSLTTKTRLIERRALAQSLQQATDSVTGLTSDAKIAPARENSCMHKCLSINHSLT